MLQYHVSQHLVGIVLAVNGVVDELQVLAPAAGFQGVHHAEVLQGCAMSLMFYCNMSEHIENVAADILFGGYQRLFACFGDPVGARTRDLLLRRQLLYPTELPDHPFCFAGAKVGIFSQTDKYLVVNLTCGRVF